MLFLRSHDTLSLILHDIMTCMYISKKYNEIHGGRTNITIRKHAKILTTPSQIEAKNSRFYRYSRFHLFQAHSESILCVLRGIVFDTCLSGVVSSLAIFSIVKRKLVALLLLPFDVM